MGYLPLVKTRDEHDENNDVHDGVTSTAFSVATASPRKVPIQLQSQ